MLLTLNLIRIEIGKICRGTVRSTDTSATGTEPRQAELFSLKTCRGTVRVAVQSVNLDLTVGAAVGKLLTHSLLTQ